MIAFLSNLAYLSEQDELHPELKHTGMQAILLLASSASVSLLSCTASELQFEEKALAHGTGAGILSMANSGPGTNGSQVTLCACVKPKVLQAHSLATFNLKRVKAYWHFAVFCDTGSNAVAGWQALHLWTRLLWHVGGEALGQHCNRSGLKRSVFGKLS